MKMNRKLVFLALMGIAACVSATPAESNESDNQLRQKRSYSWLPSFLGGGSSTSDDATVETEDEIEVPAQNAHIVGQFPDASLIGPIINRGNVINGQLHYPLWRVHKYNGLHLQPLPISYVHDGSGLQNIDPANSVDQETDSLPSPPTSTPVETWLSPELIQMAQDLGVTDFSNLPSLQDAMDVLGTTTRDETIEAIKEFAGTEDGRNLIKQFVAGGQGGDNDVAASENQETIEESEAAQAVEDAQAVQAAQAAEASRAAVPGNTMNIDNIDAATALQYFYQPFPGALLGQVSQLTAGVPETEEQSENEDPDAIETTTSAGLFGRIAQWTNFLNPLTNRQEIPIPPSKAEIDGSADIPVQFNNEHIANQNTVQIPDLPELPPLPSVPGAELPPPPLPSVHIPARYVGPMIPYTEGAAQRAGGPYVRVKLPLSGFNPTPQYFIDPKYLQHGRNQLSQLGISQAPYVLAGEKQPVPIYSQIPAAFAAPQTVVNQAAPQIRLAQGPAVGVRSPVSIVNQPNVVSQAVPAVQFVPEFQLPTTVLKPFRVIPTAPIGQPVHIGQLPLVNSANYEVFKNGPQIISSYGAPALPHAYTLEPSQLYKVSPQSPNVYIQQEYEHRPAASEVVERKIKVSDIKSENTESLNKEPVNIKEEEEEDKDVAQRANDNDQIAAESSNSDIVKVPFKSKSESQPKTIETEEEKENIEAAVEVKPSTESTIYESLRPKMKAIKTESEKKPSNIQRITSNNQTNGKIHRADPKAVDMLPFTMRNVAEDAKIDVDVDVDVDQE